MELGKIFGVPIQRTDASVRRTVPATEDTANAFARMLQNFKEMKAAEARDWAEKVGDTVITRILADGTVITQIYEGTKLISQIVTRGSHPDQGKALVSETIEKMKRQAHEQSADPLLAARAVQSSAATAAAASAML
ncbi:hypothetical protein [Selenomonas noxia]|uniref:hypothetical protein n=1 Tax=Selenomonas noxia TaxID=135083 RepID=UPI0028801D38|nr:hypothetical protein [Selenomonas noxia]